MRPDPLFRLICFPGLGRRTERAVYLTYSPGPFRQETAARFCMARVVAGGSRRLGGLPGSCSICVGTCTGCLPCTALSCGSDSRLPVACLPRAVGPGVCCLVCRLCLGTPGELSCTALGVLPPCCHARPNQMPKLLIIVSPTCLFVCRVQHVLHVMG